MISEEQFEKELKIIIDNGIREDIVEGDHTSLSCIPAETKGKAKLLVRMKELLLVLPLQK